MKDYCKDGLLYCGKCNTPKQYRIANGYLAGKIKPIMCKCESDAYKAEQERQQQQEHFDKIMRFGSNGFPDAEMSKITFAKDDKSNPRLSEIAHKYVDRFADMKMRGKGLVLYGSVGTGKTFIAACIANALIEKGYPCLVTNFARIINGVSGAPIDKKQQYFDDLNRHDLLVIDDLAAERQTDYTSEIIYNVIDARIRCGKPLIVTTNLSLYDLTSTKDIKKQRIYSRVLEMCTPVLVDFENRRLKKAKSDRTIQTMLQI